MADGLDVVIPNVVISGRVDQSGQVSPAVLNSVKPPSQITAVGANSYIPIIFGGPERTAGLFYFARIYQSRLLVVYLLSEGPVQSIDNVEVNDVALAGGSWSSDLRTFSNGVIVKRYDGSQTTVDPTLAAAVPGFNEAMTGTAYIIVQYPQGVVQGWPRVTVQGYGLSTIYDPRENFVTYSNEWDNATGWTNSGLTLVQGALAPDGTPKAWTLTDDSAGAYEYITRSFTVADDSAARSFSLRVKKTTGGTAPTFGVNLALSGGTGVDRKLRLNTDTGVDASGNWEVTSDEQDDTWWYCTTTITNNATGNTALEFALFPAASAYGGGVTDDVTATGSAVACWAGGVSGASAKPYCRASASAVAPVTAWSDNPALITAKFITDTTFGAGKLVGEAGLIKTAEYCDTLLGTTPEKRCLLTITIGDKRPVKDWINVLRAYIPGWCPDDGETVELVADGYRATDHVFNKTNVDISPHIQVAKRGVRDIPNVVEIGYLRTDVKPWAIDYAASDTGASSRTKTRIDMPGIRRYSQGKRFSVERLNHYVLEPILVQFPVFGDGLKVREGDVLELTDDIGFTAEKFRVLQAVDRGNGRWLLGGRTYDPLAFSLTVESAPAAPPLDLPDATAVGAVSNLTLVETVYLEKQITADALARGYIYQSRIEASWDASDYAYPFVYVVQFLDGSTVIHEGMTKELAYASPAVQQGKNYTVRVTVRAGTGFVSETVEETIEALGNLLDPGDVPSPIRLVELGGELIVDIDPAIDIDIIRYEWRYGAVGTFAWATGTGSPGTSLLIDRVDSLRAAFKGLPVGTWVVGVKAIDSGGRYSANATTATVTITSDANSFVQHTDFDSPTLTNMVSLLPVEGVWLPRWGTSFPSNPWSSALPSPLSSGSAPVGTYHGAGTSRWEGESWDLGQDVSGDWTMTVDVDDIDGTATYAIETSPDGSVWTVQSGISWRGTTRFIRPAIETTGTMHVNGPVRITISALARPENFDFVTSASDPYFVDLDGQYSILTELKMQAVDTPDPVTVVADRVLAHPQLGMQIEYDYTASPSACNHAVDLTARVIASGDYFEYDLFIDPRCEAASAYTNGGLYIYFTDTTDNGASVAADGYSMPLPAVGLDATARGQWVSRKADLTAYVGKTVSFVAVLCEDDHASGRSIILLRNLRYTDGAGTDRLVLFTDGGDFYNSLLTGTNIANAKCGPSNSFNAYAFDSTWAQIAQRVLASIKGV